MIFLTVLNNNDLSFTEFKITKIINEITFIYHLFYIAFYSFSWFKFKLLLNSIKLLYLILLSLGY